MLIGQFNGVVGLKNRIAFPKKFREALGDTLIITQGYEHSLIVVSESGWKALLEGTENKPFIQLEARETQRFLLGGATFVELDPKGRFVLPSYLKEFGKIENEIVFLGLSRYVEIWDKKRWEEYSIRLGDTIDTIAKRLISNSQD